MALTLLICDDEASIRELLVMALESDDLLLLEAKDPMSALTLMRDHWVDIVISDLRMPGMDGIAFLKQSREEFPRAKFILMSAFGTMETVIDAMRNGADDYLTKPVDLKQIRLTIEKYRQIILAEKVAPKANILMSGVHSSKDDLDSSFIASSDVMQPILSRARKAAVSDATLLIRGESGTGKEVLAQWIHKKSQVKDNAFVAVNCGAIPESLLESELFGHEKGAFTGAHQAKAGKFELANGGTLFLDEIGELPLSAQVKLLRAIQERKIDRVGGQEAVSVKFRLIAATHKNLEDMVKLGTFREDLFYRLNVIPFELPPLRLRNNDILELAESILQRLNQRYGTYLSFNNQQKQQMLTYSWPGNVRELENVLERSVVLSADHLEIDIPNIAILENEHSHQFKTHKKDSEKKLILSVLDDCRWNKTKTADFLGISRRSLLYKIKEMDIE